jgi:hypothetical protein
MMGKPAKFLVLVLRVINGGRDTKNTPINFAGVKYLTPWATATVFSHRV